jgi:hypothetical protein
MSDLFDEQLQALRARSLYRQLREIGARKAPASIWSENVSLIFHQMIISVSRMNRSCAKPPSPPWRNLA